MEWRPWLAVLVAVLTFCATSPFVLLDLGVLVRDLGAQVQHMTAGHFGQAAGSAGPAYYLTEVLGPGLGWGALVLALAGLAWSAARHRGPWLVLAWCVVPYYLSLACLRTQFDRYLLPLLMPLALGLAGLVTELRASPRLGRGRRGAAVLVAVAAVALVPAAVGSWGYHREKAMASTRRLATEYLRTSIDPDSSFVMAEVLGVSLRSKGAVQEISPNFLARLSGDQRARLLRPATYNVDFIPMYMVQPERSDVYYDLRHCLAHDYIVTSQAVRVRYEAEPGRFPREVGFYADLERYASLLRRFAPGPGVRGPEIRIYRLTPAGLAALLAARGPLLPGFERPYAGHLVRNHFQSFIERVAAAAYAKRMWPAAAFYYRTLLAESADGSLPEESRLRLTRIVAFTEWHAGNLASAEDLYRSYLARVPTDLGALVDLGQVFEARGNPAEARRAYEWCVRMGSARPEAGTAVGWARARLAVLAGEGGAARR
jgi:hypothetical protein